MRSSRESKSLPTLSPTRLLLLLALLCKTSAVSYKNSSTAEYENALYLHIKPFLNNDGYFDGSTISAALTKAHASSPWIKGRLISLFNSVHAGGNGPITATTDFTQHIHLGTARFWNADGSFNEENWQKFMKFVAKKQHSQHKGIVLQSTWESYIKKVAKQEGPQPGTGRNAATFFSSTYIQEKAGKKAREQALEFFPNQITVGKQGRNESFMTIKQMKEFYRHGDRWFDGVVNRLNF